MDRQIVHLPERRQFGRVNISEPKICYVPIPQSQELWKNQCMILNISLGGFYFVCDKQTPLEKDDIWHLTFAPILNDQEIYRIKFHVQVVRTECRQNDRFQFAVALRLLSNPIYNQFKEINERDFPSPDKTRIMYQHYELNNKIYEIIRTSPEVRNDRIKNIKGRIDQGLYQVQPVKLSQSLTNNLFQENILLQKR